jgi:hypothetical protein
MGKFTPLYVYLSALLNSDSFIHLSFLDIERIIQAPLPPAAHKYRAWWGNGGHAHASNWMDAGWLVDQVDFEKERISFRRHTGAVRNKEESVSIASHKDSYLNAIILVSCVKKKALSAMPARHLYLSSWFKKASAYAEKSGLEWFILSAKYGLVEPDKVINPYNQTLKMMKKSERLEWADKVMAALRPHIDPEIKIVIFAGQYYRADLIPQLARLGCAIEVPLRNMRIGEQMRWFNEHS